MRNNDKWRTKEVLGKEKENAGSSRSHGTCLRRQIHHQTQPSYSFSGSMARTGSLR